MSITSRINEMSSHIEQAYDELQGLGADLTNVNKNIENISMVLDDIYDSMPQISGEGTSLTLDDTRVGKIKSTLKGNTSQTGTPTSTSPIPVNVVSGDNEISACGKNLFNKDSVSIGYLKEDGTLSTDTAYRTSAFMPIRPNTTYYKTSTGSPRTKHFDLNKVPLNTTTYWDVPTGGSAGTFTTPNNAYYLRFSFPFTGSSAIDASTIMVKEGTDTTYEPYQGNTYNIDLPEGIELCKIGNYQDYIYKDSDKWYLHKEIGKVVLNGSEDWNKSTSYPGNYYCQSTVPYAIAFNVNCFSNLTNIFWDSLTQLSNGDNGIMLEGGGTNKTIDFKMSSISTLADFKTFLGNNNLLLYYILATPTNTEITYQPLIDQLNLLEKAMSKDGQTNISQVNNDLPFIISASALKEWQESTSLNSTLSMVSPLSLGNTLNTQENDIQPIEVDNIEPLEEEIYEES